MSATGYSETMGDRVRRLRKERCWTRTDLAANASIGVGTLAALETDQHKPNSPTVDKVAVALGVDPDTLWHGDGSNDTNAHNDERPSGVTVERPDFRLFAPRDSELEIVALLFNKLPEPGAVWPAKRRQTWLRAIQATIALIYDDNDDDDGDDGDKRLAEGVTP